MAERRRGVIRNEALPWRLRDHALFIADAPVDAPRFAAAVVIEHGIGGSAVAAPIARDCLTWLYDPARAMKTLEALEKEWGGDILDRMQAKAAQRAAEQAAREAAARTRHTLPGGDGNQIGAGEAARATTPSPPRTRACRGGGWR